MKPIDLRQLFGERYRITLDEAARHERGGRNNPWYYQIPCKRGMIYPYSDELLAFYCQGIRLRHKVRREHPDLEYLHWSDEGEAVFLFPLDRFDQIAVYARPRRRRRLSAEQRKRAAEIGTANLQKSKNARLMNATDPQNRGVTASRDSGVARESISRNPRLKSPSNRKLTMNQG